MLLKKSPFENNDKAITFKCENPDLILQKKELTWSTRKVGTDKIIQETPDDWS